MYALNAVIVFPLIALSVMSRSPKTACRRGGDRHAAGRGCLRCISFNRRLGDLYESAGKYAAAQSNRVGLHDVGADRAVGNGQTLVCVYATSECMTSGSGNQFATGDFDALQVESSIGEDAAAIVVGCRSRCARA